MHLFSTDIDGTIFDGSASALQFCDYWESLKQRPVPRLVYNTGRSLQSTMALVEETALPAPDFFICGVGTEIHGAQVQDLGDRWHRTLSHEWNFELVREVVRQQSPARPQPDEAQNDHKCSWHWEDAPQGRIDELVDTIQCLGVRAQAIYSSNRDLDFLPLRANKGNAVAWLAQQIGVATKDIVVAGDSGNDASMYAVEGVRGIVVANAEPALVAATRSERVYHASGSCTAGVMEGISRLLAEELFPASDQSAS